MAWKVYGNYRPVVPALYKKIVVFEVLKEIRTAAETKQARIIPFMIMFPDWGEFEQTALIIPVSSEIVYMYLFNPDSEE